MQQAPPEAVDGPDHRVQRVEVAPVGQVGGTEAHGGKKQADLQEKRDDKAEVAVLDGEGREPESRAQRGEHREQDEDREEQHPPVRQKTRPDAQAGEQDQHHAEIDQRDRDGRERHDEPGKINLRDEVGVGHEAAAGVGEGRGEKLPGQQSAQHEQRVGRVAGGHAGELAEDEGEHRQGDGGLDQRPDDAEHGLLVAHLDVAPGEEAQQFAETPEVAPVVPAGAAGLEDQFGSFVGGHGVRRGRRRDAARKRRKQRCRRGGAQPPNRADGGRDRQPRRPGSGCCRIRPAGRRRRG